MNKNNDNYKKYINNINIQHNITNNLLNEQNIYKHSYGIIAIKLNVNSKMYFNVKKQLKEITTFEKLKNLYSTSTNNVDLNNLKTFSLLKDQILFLLVSKKHTYGFTDLINGKYSFKDKTYIFDLLRQITPTEYNRLMTENFINLWKEVNYVKNTEEYINNNIKYIEKLEKRFNQLKEIIPKQFNNIEYIYDTPDWEFPKGRLKHNESFINCAKREFQEETGLTSKHYTILKNIEPIQEIFKGTDNKIYHYTYFIALIKHKVEIHKIITNETSKIGLYNYDDTIYRIRHYNFFRKIIIKIIYFNFLNYLSIAYNSLSNKKSKKSKKLSNIQINHDKQNNQDNQNIYDNQDNILDVLLIDNNYDINNSSSSTSSTLSLSDFNDNNILNNYNDLITQYDTYIYLNDYGNNIYNTLTSSFDYDDYNDLSNDI